MPTAAAAGPGHACWICGQPAASHQLNVRHMLAHVRSYMCMVCRRTFTRGADLSEHILEHEDCAGAADAVGEHAASGAVSGRRTKSGKKPAADAVELIDIVSEEDEEEIVTVKSGGGEVVVGAVSVSEAVVGVAPQDEGALSEDLAARALFQRRRQASPLDDPPAAARRRLAGDGPRKPRLSGRAAAAPAASPPAPASRKKGCGPPSPSPSPRQDVLVSPRMHFRRTSPIGDQLVPTFEIVRVDMPPMVSPNAVACDQLDGAPSAARRPHPGAKRARPSQGQGRRRLGAAVKKVLPPPSRAAKPWADKMMASFTKEAAAGGRKCLMCAAVMKSAQRRSAQWHVMAHLGKAPDRTCLHCGAVFRDRVALQAHKRTAHVPAADAARMRVVCANCPKEFSCKSSAKRHMGVSCKARLPQAVQP